MRKIDTIVVHCSDSGFGDAGLVREWHLERGWKDIGYHYVICNGFKRKNDFIESMDGEVQRGREDDVMGAHVKGHNARSIGICLIATNKYTDNQMTSLKILLSDLMLKYNIKPDKIFGHRELFDGKTCPTGLDLEDLRASL